MKTLIGMREFVLLELSKRNVYYYQDSKVLNKINNYANFLSRQPQLSDFVACGKDGLPLDKKQFHYTEKGLKQLSGIELYIALSINKESEEYQQVLDKVLFKGFEVQYSKYQTGLTVLIHLESGRFFAYLEKEKWVFYPEYTTLESLTPYNLELTDNAIKIIGV